MRKIISLLLALLIMTAPLFCSGCDEWSETTGPAKTDWDIAWNMHGLWIGEDGQIEEEIVFSLSGKAVYDPAEDGHAELKMAINWPEDFRFFTGEEKTYTPQVLTKNESEFFLISFMVSDDLQTERVEPANFGLAPEQKYFLIYWDNIPGYLIASADPNTDRAKIEAFFSNMMTDERFQ